MIHNGDIDHMSDDELRAELTRLQAKKLRHEIKELQLHWWQRPAWLAAAATVTAAVVGLTWALANGVFENRKRELWLETRDLQARRDAQSEQFDREKAQYATTITELTRRANELRREIARLDVPYVARSGIGHGPWLPLGTTETPTVWVTGKDFGSTGGQLHMRWTVTAGGKLYTLADSDTETHDGLWRSDLVEAHLPNLSRERLLAAVHSEMRGVRGCPPDCTLGMIVWVVRKDGRASMPLQNDLPSAMAWLLRK